MAESNSILLAVDTCSGQSSIALAEDTGGQIRLLGRVQLASEWTSTALHVEIANLLGRQGLHPADLCAYAVTSGPGSFTAVRIGTAAVKGLAEVHGKPVVAVSTLALIAQAAVWMDTSAPADAVWIPVLDARRAQVFSGLYRQAGGSLELLESETVAGLRTLLERCRELAGVPVRFCSTAPEPYAEAIRAAALPAAELLSVPPELSDVLARMGIEALRRGGGVPAPGVDANYIRASDAELFWKG